MRPHAGLPQTVAPNRPNVFDTGNDRAIASHRLSTRRATSKART